MSKTVAVALGIMLWPALAFGDVEKANPVSPEDKADNQQCISYGTKVGSKAYVDCRLRLSEQRKQNVAAPPSTNSPRVMHCRTIFFGGISRTRCK